MDWAHGNSSSPSAPAPKPAARSPGLAALLSVSAVLLITWSLAIPIFESPDEPAHWEYARYLHDHHRLPVCNPTLVEGCHPPLYYVLVAPFAAETEKPVLTLTRDQIRNCIGYRADVLPIKLVPPASNSRGPQREGVRFFQRRPRELTLYAPIRIARLFTAFLSVLTIWFCYRLGVEASGKPATGLLTGALVAFLPEFTFRGMSVSNDALVTALCALALYLTVRLIKRGFSWKIGLLAALAMAGAFLAKFSALFLPMLLSLAVLSQKGPWKPKLIRVTVLNLFVLAIVSPWLLRDRHLYGDLLSEKALLAAVPQQLRVKPLVSQYFLSSFPVQVGESFVGRFGWATLTMHRDTVRCYFIFLAFGALFWVLALWKRRVDARLAAVLLSAFALNFSVLVSLNLTFSQPQGRYLFPALPAIALMLALGFESQGWWSRRLTITTVSVLAVSNLLIVVHFLAPRYWGARF